MEGRRSLLLRAAIGGALLAAVGVGLLVAYLLGGNDQVATVERASDREKVTHEYVIPAGTAARIAAGETVNIVPARLEVRVGDTVRIRNEDSEQAAVGIFFVGPQETVTMRFSTPGILEGVCDVHESGKFIIDVKA